MTSFKAFEPSDAMIRALKARVGPNLGAALEAEPEVKPPPSIDIDMPTNIAYPAGAGHDAPSFRAAAATPDLVAPLTTPSASSAAPVAAEPQQASPTRSPVAASERRRPKARAGPCPKGIAAYQSRQAAAALSRRPSAGASGGELAARAGRYDQAMAMHRALRAESMPASVCTTPSWHAASSSRPTPSAASGRPPLPVQHNEPIEHDVGSPGSRSAPSPSMARSSPTDALLYVSSEPAQLASHELSVPGTPVKGSLVAGLESTGYDDEAMDVPHISDRRWQQLEAEAMKIPSVLTAGGVPVAQDGDLVYLGGGQYAAVTPAPQQELREAPPRRRRLPGRVRAPPSIPRSVRSSNHRSLGTRVGGHEAPHVGSQNGSRSGSRCGTDVGSPMHAWSDGQQLDDEHVLRHDSEHGGAVASTAPAKSRPGPIAWRPAGVAKLPPPEEPPRPFRQPAMALADLGPAAGHSEARVRDREAHRREAGPGLFGRDGFLRQLAEEQHEPLTAQRREGVLGAPLNSEWRAAERSAVRDARTRVLLEERAARLQAEAALNASKANSLQQAVHRGMAGSSSAPALGIPRLRLDSQPQIAKEDLEEQKLRLACKMEILDFFNGYHNAIGKMTAEQTKLLLTKLHSGLDSSGLSETVQQCENERNKQRQEWCEKSQQVEDAQSVQRRLQQVNDLCNKAFENSTLDETEVAL